MLTNKCEQKRIKSEIDFPIRGDYCRYQLRVDADDEVIGCHGATFIDSHVSAEHVLRNEKKRKNVKSVRVNAELFSEIARLYGDQVRARCEEEHYSNMNGFELKEVPLCLCLFEMGFCARNIRSVLRRKNTNNCLSSFGLPNEVWKAYDAYASIFEFIDSFRGKLSHFKTVMKNCVMLNPERFLHSNSRPLIFRSLGELNVAFFEQYTSCSFSCSLALPAQFEYSRKDFFTEDQLVAMKSVRIVSEEVTDFVVATDLLACIATVCSLRDSAKLSVRYSNSVLHLDKNMRKFEVSFSDRKSIRALHMLACGEMYFEVGDEDEEETYDAQRRTLGRKKCDVYLHNANCLGSKELAYMLYHASQSILLGTMHIVLSNGGFVSKAWHAIESIARPSGAVSSCEKPGAGWRLGELVRHVEHLREVDAEGICLTDVSLPAVETRFLEKGDCVFSSHHAVFGRVCRVSAGWVTLFGDDLKLPVASVTKAPTIENTSFVPVSCESRNKLSERLILAVCDESVVSRMSTKMSAMTAEPHRVVFRLRQSLKTSTFDDSDESVEFVSRFRL